MTFKWLSAFLLAVASLFSTQAARHPRTTPRLSLAPSPTVISTPMTMPTPMVSDNSIVGGAVNPVILGTCSEAIHDKYVVTGPDGKKYRTWHPQVDPSGCVFAHEHGMDPTKSVLDPSLPAFGYIGNLVGDNEAHEGFKVFVANAGDKNEEGRTNLHNARIVFHMGTGGVKRFDMSMHSLDYKVITNDGRKLFVQGMADTGKAGSICDNPRQGRTILSLGCQVDSAYEIWEEKLTISNGSTNLAQAVASTAVFDPITVMNPADHTQLIYVWDQLAKPIFKFNDDRSGYRGCDREAYFGPTYWWNNSGTQVFYTDAMGQVMAGGPLRQEISTGDTHGVFKATADGETQFKLRKNMCAAGLGIKN